jgi:hypothetical protein
MLRMSMPLTSACSMDRSEVQGNLFSVGTNGYTIPDAVAALAQSGQCHIIT